MKRKTSSSISASLSSLAGLALMASLWSGPCLVSAQEINVKQSTNAETAQVQSAPAVENTESNSATQDTNSSKVHIRREAIVVFGKDVELKANEQAAAVVVIGGSAKVFGGVERAVVAIGGNVETHGNVGEAVVAVGGNVEVHGSVHENAVAVMGNVKLAPGASVEGDVVSVGGKTDIAESAHVRGRVQDVDIAVPGLPIFKSLGVWLRECVFKLRPLAPQVGWVWVVAGLAFLVYLLVALAMAKPVQFCLNELTDRPATTFLYGLLAKLLLPIIVLLLAATGVGLLVVPLISAALFFAAIIGKVALLEYFGGSLGRPFGLPAEKPIFAFLIGIVLTTLLYMVPVVGFITYSIIGIWGLGVALTGAFKKMRREPPLRGSSPGPAAPATMPAGVAAPVASNLTSGAVAADPLSSMPSASSTIAEPPVQPPLPPALAHPRAGFWERMGAAFLDMALVTVVGGWMGPLILVVALAYFAGMWTWKGTTIGGIVLKLQVVREDGGPITFLVALVRGLAAAFSALVLFLGFFWIGWDPGKQGWHDKIAGTVVVRLPRSMPLVCL